MENLMRWFLILLMRTRLQQQRKTHSFVSDHADAV